MRAPTRSTTIATGFLLTTSPARGFAMRMVAGDDGRAAADAAGEPPWAAWGFAAVGVGVAVAVPGAPAVQLEAASTSVQA